MDHSKEKKKYIFNYLYFLRKKEKNFFKLFFIIKKKKNKKKLLTMNVLVAIDDEDRSKVRKVM